MWINYFSNFLDILSPNHLINLEIDNKIKHYLISRLRKRVDQALILISTIQKFPAQFSDTNSFYNSFWDIIKWIGEMLLNFLYCRFKSWITNSKLKIHNDFNRQFRIWIGGREFSNLILGWFEELYNGVSKFCWFTSDRRTR